jgi:hypothetical protein
LLHPHWRANKRTRVIYLVNVCNFYLRTREILTLQALNVHHSWTQGYWSLAPTTRNHFRDFAVYHSSTCALGDHFHSRYGMKLVTCPMQQWVKLGQGSVCSSPHMAMEAECSTEMFRNPPTKTRERSSTNGANDARRFTHTQTHTHTHTHTVLLPSTPFVAFVNELQVLIASKGEHCQPSRNNQQYALVCTTPLVYILAPKCFSSNLTSGSFLGPSELFETYESNRMGGISKIYNMYIFIQRIKEWYKLVHNVGYFYYV